MKFIGIIPARYQSTRFPGKPLALIHGKPMIQWVYERSAEALSEVWVATDDQQILDAVKSFGGNAIMTSTDHRSGTDRCAEAALRLSSDIDFDVVVNIQGDEPFIQPEQIRKLKSCFKSDADIATLVRKISDLDELADPNKPKVVLGVNSDALYFSRAAIPYTRDFEMGRWLEEVNYWAHIGIYAYRKDILQQITRLLPGTLEKAESLEQLRWLENGFRIRVAETDYHSFGIDTPEDLQRALKLFPA
jgi:3-deoxy-manno-octulosonate cytidylyltransferase (CMP-KDO synthetase)